MIPVVSMDKNGELVNQVFNDNLTPAEQINRKLFAVTVMLQNKLTNGWSAVERKIGTGEADVDAINTKATALYKSATELVTELDGLLAD